jgi:hypothetical protein
MRTFNWEPLLLLLLLLLTEENYQHSGITAPEVQDQ